MNDQDKSELAIQRMRAAAVGFINGKTPDRSASRFHADDGTHFGGLVRP
jgi:hypothetical protein